MPIAAWTARGLAWLGPSLALVAFGYRQRWVTEDAFITFRVVANLLAGDGPVYNLRRARRGVHAPLWLAMLAALQGLGADLARSSPFLGLALAVTGLLAAQAASARVVRHLHGDDRTLRLVPLGALVFVALRVVWDFATSGLETGLIFGWLGGAYALVARVALGDAVPSAGRRAAGVAAFVVGLGPLVRPDLAVMSAAFLVVLFALPGPRGGRRMLEIAKLSGLALALPVAYQVFRMGYFAATVPNTALAKEAGEAYWGQGLLYVRDFVGTYWLWIPGLLLLVWMVRDTRRAPGIARLLLLAPVVAAALHAVWVVRVGGDFMHGRFLLPSLFAALAPPAMVRAPARRRSLDALVIAAVIAWAVACGLFRGSSPATQPAPIGIVDERGFYFEGPGRPAASAPAGPRTGGTCASGRRRTRARSSGTSTRRRWRPPSTSGSPSSPPARTSGSSATRPDRACTLWTSAGSPIPSRAACDWKPAGGPGTRRRSPSRGSPRASPAWRRRRASAPRNVRAARAALRCGRLAELLDAISAPLTLDRFTRNVVASVPLSRLRIPTDPERARAELCEGR